jgi:hypothetical protein
MGEHEALREAARLIITARKADKRSRQEVACLRERIMRLLPGSAQTPHNGGSLESLNILADDSANRLIGNPVHAYISASPEVGLAPSHLHRELSPTQPLHFSSGV